MQHFFSIYTRIIVLHWIFIGCRWSDKPTSLVYRATKNGRKIFVSICVYMRFISHQVSLWHIEKRLPILFWPMLYTKITSVISRGVSRVWPTYKALQLVWKCSNRCWNVWDFIINIMECFTNNHQMTPWHIFNKKTRCFFCRLYKFCLLHNGFICREVNCQLL